MMKTVLLALFTALVSAMLVIGAYVETSRKQEPFHWVTGR